MLGILAPFLSAIGGFLGNTLLSSGKKVLQSAAPAVLGGLALGKTGFKSYMSGVTGSALTPAQVQQNEFTMSQQQAQQDFNAAEAEKNRQFQADMSNTANQRAVADMQAAGLNPAMMYGGNGASASTPSGSAASSAAPAGSSSSNVYGGLLNNLIDMAFTAERFEGMRLDNENKRIQNAIQGIELDNQPAMISATLDNLRQNTKTQEASMRNFLQAVKNGEADVLLKEAQVSKTAVESVGENLRNMMQYQENEYYAMTRELEKQFLELQNAKTAEEVKLITAQIGLTWAECASEQVRKEVLGLERSQITEETKLIIKQKKLTGLNAEYQEVINKYANAGEIMKLIGAGSSSFRDIAFGVGSMRSGLGGLFSNRSSSSGPYHSNRSPF